MDSNLWTRYDTVSVPEVLRRRQATKNLASQIKKNYKSRDISRSPFRRLFCRKPPGRSVGARVTGTVDVVHAVMNESRDCDVDKDIVPPWHTADLHESKAL